MEQLLSKRIRTYRERLEMSQEDLAKSAGLDLALLQAIENAQVYPALGVLVKLSRALGQRLGTFMDDQFREDPLIVRKEARKEEMAQHKGEVLGPVPLFSTRPRQNGPPYGAVLHRNRAAPGASHLLA